MQKIMRRNMYAQTRSILFPVKIVISKMLHSG